RVRWRGYRAFWIVALTAPFASWTSPQVDAGAIVFPHAMTRLAAGSIALVLLLAVGPMFGAWGGIATAAGALGALRIHAWYDLHPTAIPAPAEPQWRSPQINFSSTEVAGNIGGLIFVVGSVFIVVVGVPTVIWFLFAGTVAGCVLAWGLAAWHTSHPK